MSQQSNQNDRNALEQWINMTHGPSSAAVFDKTNFLHEAWYLLSSLVYWNKQNPLIHNAVREYPDLIPRGFAILTMLYGAFTLEPSKRSFLVDFVSLLGKDLVEEEIAVCAYAKSKCGKTFFAELPHMLEAIRDVYGAEHFRLEVLPPTPHHAYVLIVLNKPELLGKHIGNAELFGHLSVYDSMMRRAFELIANSRNKNPVKATQGRLPK